jgi:superfamily I DNA/RNA helicase
VIIASSKIGAKKMTQQTIPYDLSSLSRQQADVVCHIDGHNCVVAIPGSGKTHTLTYASDYLLDINPSARPCVVTFTNAAVNEMRERLKSFLSPSKFEKVTVCTFDSLFLKMAKTLGRVDLVLGGQQLPYIYRALNSTNISLAIDDAKSRIDHYGMMSEPKKDEGDTSGWGVYLRYIELLKVANKTDLNQVRKNVINALTIGTIKPYGITHCLVDEFQDTDSLQMRWVSIHGKAGTKITAVGDDDQAIYGFRGGVGYKNMQELHTIFDAKMHVLTECRRCAPEVLSAAGKLIQFNLKRVEKKMVSSKPKGGMVEFFSYTNKSDELDTILIATSKLPTDWAVLARNNGHLDDIEKHYIANDVPCHRLSGKSIWDQFEVIMFLNLLSLISRKNVVSSLENTLVYFGEPDVVIDSLVWQAKKTRTISNLLENNPELSPKSQDTRELFRLLDNQASDTNEAGDIQERCNSILHLINFAKPSQSKGKLTYSKDYHAAHMLLNRILKMKGSFHLRLRKLVEKLTARDSKGPKEGEGVALSTLHGVKGLQFPNVWMMTFNEGVLPSEEGSVSLQHREEERRLAYVGMTRAEQRLVISSSNKVSTFLTESFPEVYGKNTDFVREVQIEECF